MDAVVPDWVTFAASMPIAFAQVREDSLLDVEILERIGGRQIRGIMIASGGCTAAALVASGRLTELHLVDMNPAQLALSRLKLDLLHTAMPQERAEILGHAPLSINERSARLGEALRRLELSPDVLGPPSFVAEVGPDQAGRYELLFAQLRHEIRGFTSEIVDLLNLDDTAERIRRTRPEAPLGRAIDEAFEHGMALPHLVRLFGAQATQNSLESFAKHFARRTRQAIALGCTVDNPYLWQLLTGKFPNGVTTPWMSAMPPSRLPEVIESHCTFDMALACFCDRFDFVHLSNILDWLDPDQARRTLQLASCALRPGGYVLIRQLNSALDIPSLDPSFDWLAAEAGAMHARDRSFFYRDLHLGRKR